MKIIVDTNLWISFTIGKRLALLENIVLSDVTVIVSREIIAEYLEVCRRPKFRRYITDKDIQATLRLMDVCCELTTIERTAVSDIRDADDLFLLSLADSCGADYIVTGDKDLLVLRRHNATCIVDINTFITLLPR